jgi:hypothetical protein
MWYWEFTQTLTSKNIMKFMMVASGSGMGWRGLLLAGWLCGAAALPGADAGLAVVYKGLFYDQTGPATVTARPGTNAAQFSSFVNLTAAGSILSASVRSPAPVTYPMTLDGDEFNYHAGFSSQAALDAVFANGTYQLSLSTAHDGNRTFNLSLNNNSYPNTPQINEFDAAQAVNPDAPFALSWQPFAGGTVNDLILLQIWDPITDSPVFSTPLPGQAGAYNGTSNSVVIPAGVLTAGRTYEGELLFFRPTALDILSYPGATGIGGYVKSTTFPITAAGANDTTAPWLRDAYPSDNHSPVAVNAEVAFVFSEPMRGDVSISWRGPAGFNAANFTYSWSTNRMILFCLYAGNLPANASIGWTLNPPGQEQFRDLAGNLLPTMSGGFATGSETATPDVAQYILYKAKYLEQTSATNVGPVSRDPFALGVDVPLTTFVAATNAALAAPGGGTLALEFDGDEFWNEAAFATKAELDAAFPAGAYTLTVNTVHDGTRVLPLVLPADAYPNAPRLSNYAAAQAINPTNDFTLTWDAFNGGTTNDFVRVSLEEVIAGDNNRDAFKTPDFGQPGALNGTHASCVIPANTLPPGRQFLARLMFARRVGTNLNSYPGAVGVVAYVSETSMTLATSGEPVRARLLTFSFQDGHFHGAVIGPPDRPYTVEYSDNLTSWTRFWSEWTNDGYFEFNDNPPPNAARRFYRVREGW